MDSGQCDSLDVDLIGSISHFLGSKLVTRSRTPNNPQKFGEINSQTFASLRSKIFSVPPANATSFGNIDTRHTNVIPSVQQHRFKSGSILFFQLCVCNTIREIFCLKCFAENGLGAGVAFLYVLGILEMHHLNEQNDLLQKHRTVHKTTVLPNVTYIPKFHGKLINSRVMCYTPDQRVLVRSHACRLVLVNLKFHSQSWIVFIPCSFS